MSGGADDDRTRQTAMPPAGPDDEPTAEHAELAAVAELRAAFGDGQRRAWPLYALPDSIVVGRGTASDWQLDDASLSRKHCRLEWSGRELTVEDLGSANGTRVGGKPARPALAVSREEVVQLGTVTITFVPLSTTEPSPDEQATRLVAAPAGEPAGTGEITPLSPVATVATVVRPPAAPPAADAQLFRPAADGAGPDEPTRPWDTRAVLIRAPAGSLDARALWSRLTAAWHANRRPFVLAGAALWVGLLVLVLTWKSSRNAAEEEHEQQQPVAVAPPASPAPARVVEPSVDRERDLADAVAAYDQGKLDEALRLFRRLAADPDDKAAEFMVQLIESRSGDGKGGLP